LCYFGCYAGKTILSAISPFLQTNQVFSSDDIGTMGFALFLAYGFGQLVNGTIGDYISPKNLAFLGLSVAGILVMTIPMFTQYGLSATTAVWAVIGFFCSMLWGPLTKIIAENSTGDTGRKLMLALNASLVGGTLMAYLTASIVAAFFDWKVAFYAAGTIMILCAVVYFCIITALESKHIIVCSGIKRIKNYLQPSNTKLSFSFMMKNALIPTVVYCMVNGFVRNAVSFWIPLYIKETFGVSDAFASAITIVLPLFNFAGTFLGIILLKARVFRNSEHILCATLFTLTTVMFALLVLIGKTSLILALICLVLASASMNSVCNLIYAVYVFRYKSTGRISTFTGALDCSAYISSAAGTKSIGLLVTALGWSVTVGIWCGIAGLGLSACVISAVICRKNGVESSAE